jgi:hypothetical protein
VEYGVVAVMFGDRGDYAIESVAGSEASVDLRVLAKRGGEDLARAKLIATIHLSAEEAHDLGWVLRSAILESRRDAKAH